MLIFFAFRRCWLMLIFRCRLCYAATPLLIRRSPLLLMLAAMIEAMPRIVSCWRFRHDDAAFATLIRRRRCHADFRAARYHAAHSRAR